METKIRKCFIQIDGIKIIDGKKVPSMKDWSAELSFPLNFTDLNMEASQTAEKEGFINFSIIHFQVL